MRRSELDGDRGQLGSRYDDDEEEYVDTEEGDHDDGDGKEGDCHDDDDEYADQRLIGLSTVTARKIMTSNVPEACTLQLTILAPEPLYFSLNES